MISFGFQGAHRWQGLSVVLSLARSLLLALCCYVGTKDGARYVLCVVSHSYHCDLWYYVWLCCISTASRYLREEVTVISSVKIGRVPAERGQGSQMSAPGVHGLPHLGHLSWIDRDLRECSCLSKAL